MIKNNLHGLRHLLFTTLFLALGLLLPRGATSAEEITIPVADPSRPVHLVATIQQGSITVEAYTGDQVILEWTEEGGDHDDDRGRERREDGLIRIPNSSFGLTAEADGNEVKVKSGWQSELDVKLRVPRTTSVSLNSTNGDEIVVRGVTGEHEVRTVNGDIELQDVGGSAVISTTNGDVVVVFASVTANKAMSFTTFNGDVDVSFPPGFGADLVMSSMQGDIYSERELELKPTASQVERGNGRFRLEVKREMQARLGGGGPEVRFKTFNGDIRIRTTS